MNSYMFNFLVPLKVEGADAAGFLHSQLTTDVAGLASGQAGLSAWCDPKGRVIATFILARLDETYWLLLPGALKEVFIKRLKMYVLRSAVNIVDATCAPGSCATVSVPAKDITTLLPGLAANPDQSVICHNDYTLVTYPADVTTILTGREKISRLRRAYETYFLDMDRRTLNKTSIRQGIPWLQAETSGRFLPQELNLDTLNALSFDKGCYPGQEIIARLRYRGEVKRYLCYATTENRTPLEPGAGLVSEEEGKNIGAVVNSTVTDKGQELLVVLERDHIESGKVIVKDIPGCLLRVYDDYDHSISSSH